MIVLISPAKRLNIDKQIKRSLVSEPENLEQSKQIMHALSRMSVDDLMSIQNVSYSLAVENFERNQYWMDKDGKGELSAVDMFDGEVYRGLNAANWSEITTQYAQDHLRIISGVYGMLRPLDQVLPYRLEMGTKLQIKSSKDLYSFWKSDLVGSLKKLSNGKPILNLASTEYSKVIRVNELESQMHEVNFLEDKRDSKPPRAIQMYLKQARGTLARFVLENQIESISDLAAFEESGYHLDKTLSTPIKTVFLRHH